MLVCDVCGKYGGIKGHHIDVISNCTHIERYVIDLCVACAPQLYFYIDDALVRFKESGMSESEEPAPAENSAAQ